MHWVLLTFVIGVINLWLGYTLAVWLGYGPPSLRDAWAAVPASPPAAAGDDEAELLVESVLQEQQEAEAESDAPPPTEVDSPAESTEPPEISLLDRLRRMAAAHASRLADVSARLKQGDACQYGRTAWGFVGELQEICEPHVEALSDVTERLFHDANAMGEETPLADEVQQIILEQAAQLETTVSNLRYMDFDSSYSTAMRRLRADTENTLSVARRLHEALEAPAVASDEQVAEAADEAADLCAPAAGE